MDVSKGWEHRGSCEAGVALEVNVVFTESGAAMACLRRAEELARGMEARIRLVVPRVVPWALPLDRPAVAAEHERQRMRELARAAGVAVEVEIVYGREMDRILDWALRPGSLIVLGAERRLRKRLTNAGHEVIVVKGRGKDV